VKRVWLILLLWPAVARADLNALVSPGPLSAAHHALESKCDACHVPFKGVPDVACLTCHTSTAQRIQAHRGPHAEFAQQGKRCASCHSDHKGEKHALSPAPASGFDHKKTGFVLDGAHASRPCASCHKPGPSGPVWAGLPMQCKGCHTDVHKGGFGDRCAACHDAKAWKPTVKTVAQHKLDMGGHHAGLKCESCHEGGQHLQASSQCGDCHAQPHGGTKAPCSTCHNPVDWKNATFKHDFCTCILPGKHQTASCLSCHPKFRFTPTEFECAGCHTKDRKHENLGACSRCHSALSWKAKSFDHNKARPGYAPFVLDGKHLQVGCENCHKEQGKFRGAPRLCEGCHAVPKHGDFGACSKCHTTLGFATQKFSHDKTRFPLDGKHKAQACESCHTKFKPGGWAPGSGACSTCHADVHRGQFAGRSCADCHTTSGWKPSSIGAVEHGALGFELRGWHVQVSCARCHLDGQFRGTKTACADCHVDRHRGKLGRDCAQCHLERGWRPVKPGFDHKATGFVLEGAHDGVGCAQCHGLRREKLATVKQVSCATCHTPRHGPDFGTNCVKCHKVTTWTDVPSFDHAHTLFPLAERHRALPCVACHDVKKPRRSGGDPSTCRPCHGDPHRGRTQAECGDCHRADRWSLVRFDHDRTIFPLRGHHFTVPCRDCHTNDQFTGTRSECISCHRGDRRRADAAHMDHRANSFDCSECHKAFSW
jgi:hypothetical protein